MSATSRRPRILVVAHQFYSRAGVEEHLRTLLAEVRTQVDFWVLFPHRDQLHLLRGFERDVAAPASPPHPFPGYREPRTGRALKAMLDRVRPDLVHVGHFVNWPLDLFDRLCAIGVPVVGAFHDYALLTPHYSLQGVDDPVDTVSAEHSLRHFGQDISGYLVRRREILRQSLGRLAARVVPSKFLADRLGTVFQDPFTVIGNGIHAFQPLPDAIEAEFGFIGQLIPQKGWQTLLEAFARLRRLHPQARLTVHGGDRPAGVQAPGVAFHGGYGPEDLPRILSGFEIGVVPSEFPETYCLVLSELWQGRRPVLAADIGALGERVREGGGQLFPAGDPERLATAMAWFLEHPDWRQWPLPRPRSSAEMARDYLALWESALKNSER